MAVNIPESSLIACICEGGAETAIMDILLNNDLLVFKREQLLDERVLPRSSVSDFQKRYLRQDYPAPVMYEGLTYQNNEAAFQAQKTFSPELQTTFTTLAPSDAKRKGRHVRLVVNNPYMLINIVAAGNVLQSLVKKTQCVISLTGNIQMDTVTVFCINYIFDFLKILRLCLFSFRNDQMVFWRNHLTGITAWLHPAFSHIRLFWRLHTHNYTSQLSIL